MAFVGPQDAAEMGTSRLRTAPGCLRSTEHLHFRLPVVCGEYATSRSDSLILMIDQSIVTAEEPGFYTGDGRIVEDPVEDLYSFYGPIKRALIARLQARY